MFHHLLIDGGETIPIYIGVLIFALFLFVGFVVSDDLLGFFGIVPEAGFCHGGFEARKAGQLGVYVKDSSGARPCGRQAP